MNVLPAATSIVPSGDPGTAKLWRAAQDFEAMALNQLLTPMFATVDSAHGTFGGGDGEETWKPMMVQELSKNMSRHCGLGLAVPVYNQMLRMQEAEQEKT